MPVTRVPGRLRGVMAQQTEIMGTYVVRAGDTLSSIAKTQLGSAIKWRELMEENADQLSEIADLKPGMTVRLPRVGSPPPESDRRPWKESESA